MGRLLNPIFICNFSTNHKIKGVLGLLTYAADCSGIALKDPATSLESPWEALTA